MIPVSAKMESPQRVVLGFKFEVRHLYPLRGELPSECLRFREN